MNEINISDIVVLNRLRQDLGNLDNLTEDIRTNGLQNPILVQDLKNGKYKLIAGERRLESIKNLGYTKIQARITDIKNEDDAIELEISENVNRKSFNLYELVLCGIELEKIEKKKAEARQKNGTKIDLSQNFGKGRVDEIIAKKLGIGSHEQYRKYKKIVSVHGILTKKEFDAWSNGEQGFSTNKVLKMIEERTQSACSKENGEHDKKTKPDVDKSLKLWKSSFKNVNNTITSTLSSFKNVHIYNQRDKDVSENLFTDIEDCLNKINSILTKLNNITISETGILSMKDLE